MDAAHWWWFRRDPPHPTHDCKSALSAQQYTIKHYITASFICFFPQECPSGVVNEETFKHIYAQFFPHGGTKQREILKYYKLLMIRFR